MSEYDIAFEYAAKYAAIKYPENLTKPVHHAGISHEAYGRLLDGYERERKTLHEVRAACNKECRKIELEFKEAIGREFGILENPKFEALYTIAWEQGHSSGFTEVAQWVALLAPLIEDSKS